MARKAICKMCGEETRRPVKAYAVSAGPTGEPVPGAREQTWLVCPSCADLLDGGDDAEDNET